MPSLYSEDILIEQPAIVLPNKLGGGPLNCYEETFGSGSTLGRDTSSEVVLVSRPVPALEKLNPSLPLEAFTPTIIELLRDRPGQPSGSEPPTLRKLLRGRKECIRPIACAGSEERQVKGKIL